MAIVRCKICGLNHSKTKRTYATKVIPVGYPDTALICGRSKYKNPGLVWPENDEVRAHEKGEKILENNGVRS